MRRIFFYEVVGGWMMLVSFVNLPENYEMWNDVGVGAILILQGFGIKDDTSIKKWVPVILGFWLLFSAFIPALTTEPGSSWNALIVSLALIYLGFHLYKFPSNVRAGR